MDVKDIRRLLDALTKSDIDEFSLETSDYKLSIRRGSASLPGQPAVVAQQATPAQSAPAAAREPEPASAEAPAPAPANERLVEVNAPIVGTFYAAPSPDSEPYVKVGDRVERGQVLCIIEAMKLMNEIEAEVSGTIEEILVRNEDPVEYGQVLFRIDPS